MQGKTIYLSSENGRSFAVAATFSKQNKNMDLLNRGLIIEQGILKRTVIHELGHIVDVHGIQGAQQNPLPLQQFIPEVQERHHPRPRRTRLRNRHRSGLHQKGKTHECKLIRYGFTTRIRP